MKRLAAVLVELGWLGKKGAEEGTPIRKGPPLGSRRPRQLVGKRVGILRTDDAERRIRIRVIHHFGAN